MMAIKLDPDLKDILLATGFKLEELTNRDIVLADTVWMQSNQNKREAIERLKALLRPR